jgi:hypothetical protein
VNQVARAVGLAFLREPPGWTRLEPQSVSGDPTPGLEARVLDPLWMLTRQWQFGEFHAEDVGSPVHLEVRTAQTPVGAFRPGDPAGGARAREWRPGDLLEPIVEQDLAGRARTGLLERADSGAQLMTELREIGVGDTAVTALLTDCPLTLSWDDARDEAAAGLIALLQDRVPEPGLVASRMSLDSTPQLPTWFDGEPEPDRILATVLDWYDWYRSGSGPGDRTQTDSWIDDRLEYRFSLGLDAGADGGQDVMHAEQFGGGRVEWYSLDRAPASAQELEVGHPLPPAVRRTTTVLATPGRFAGMPAGRYWEFEDAAVNLGALQAQPHDLARLALVEFALIYGNDWLAVPVDVLLGSYVTVDGVTVTTTFGEQVEVPAVDDAARPGRFRMFGTGVAGSDDTVPGLLFPPTAPASLDGAAVEEVLFVRDELANLAWAVERRVEGPSGLVRNRSDEPRPQPFTPSIDPGADMDYQLQNEVPDWWIPMVSISTGYGTVALRKGAMVKDGAPVLPLGSLLRPGEPLTLQDEEVPREGVRVRRVPTLARRADGTYVRWVTRRVTVGRGEGGSGLAFDSAVRRRPAAP